MNDTNRLISVIIPTYNRRNMVVDAVKSALSQTYPWVEVIVVDDGSTDGTDRELENIRDARLKYYALSHVGRSAARNHGIRVSSGDLVAFLDSDDLFLPHKLERQVPLIMNDWDIGAVYSSALIVDMTRQSDHADHAAMMMPAEGKREMMHEARISGDIYRNIMMYNHRHSILLPTVLVRKDMVERVGYFDETMSRLEDIDLWRRISKISKFQAISEPLVIVRKHEGNSTELPQDLLCAVDRYVDKVFREDALLNCRGVVALSACEMYRVYARYMMSRKDASWTYRYLPFLRSWRYGIEGLICLGVESLRRRVEKTARKIKKILAERARRLYNHFFGTNKTGD